MKLSKSLTQIGLIYNGEYYNTASTNIEKSEYLWRNWYFKHQQKFTIESKYTNDLFRKFVDYLNGEKIQEAGRLTTIALDFECEDLLILAIKQSSLKDAFKIYKAIIERGLDTQMFEKFLSSKLLDSSVIDIGEEIQLELLNRLCNLRLNLGTKRLCEIAFQASKVYGTAAGVLLQNVKVEEMDDEDVRRIQHLIGGPELISLYQAMKNKETAIEQQFRESISAIENRIRVEMKAKYSKKYHEKLKQSLESERKELQAKHEIEIEYYKQKIKQLQQQQIDGPIVERTKIQQYHILEDIINAKSLLGIKRVAALSIGIGYCNNSSACAMFAIAVNNIVSISTAIGYQINLEKSIESENTYIPFDDLFMKYL